jgi:hypothetical protein
MTKNDNKQLKKEIDVMLSWGEILRNNPTFDQVYDYLQEYFAICGQKLDMNDPTDAKFIQQIMVGYKVTK